MEVSMKTKMKITSLGMVVFSGIAWADAAPHGLTLTNQSGSTITAITAIEKTAPDTVLPIVFSGELSNLESDTATIALPDGVCVVDVTYALASGEKIVQQNVDLCSVDGVIVE
jgi:invasion protein IalB